MDIFSAEFLRRKVVLSRWKWLWKWIQFWKYEVIKTQVWDGKFYTFRFLQRKRAAKKGA